jgi:hypothetical protein
MQICNAKNILLYVQRLDIYQSCCVFDRTIAITYTSVYDGAGTIGALVGRKTRARTRTVRIQLGHWSDGKHVPA